MATNEPVQLNEVEQLARAVICRYRSETSQPVMVGSWTVEQFATGFNGVVWRASSPGDGELAVKLSAIDARHRGAREFAATRRLADAGLDVAPVPFALVEDGDLTAFVSSWRSGRTINSLPHSNSPLWSEVVGTYAAVHEAECSGLEAAVDGLTVGDDLDLAEMRATRAGRDAFLPLLREIRKRIDHPYSDVRTRALTHCDTGFTNWLVDGDAVRLVDWEYAGVGDPCADIAGICTHPSHLDLDESIRERLIHEHAIALGSEELVERTHAFVLAGLAIWCVRTGAAELFACLPGAVGRQRFGEEARVDHYRDRLCVSLQLDRSELDRALQIT